MMSRSQMIRFAAVMVLPMMLAACGRAPLTDEQKKIFADTTASAGRAQEAAKPANGAGTRLASSYAVSGESQRLLTSMRSQVTEDACHPTFNMSGLDGLSRMSPGTVPSEFNLGFTMAAAGDRCPISMAMGFTMSIKANAGRDAGEIKGNMKIDYAVRDESFRRLNDVDAISLSGPIEGKGDAGGAKAEAEFKGQIHSQSQGVIKTTIRSKVNASRDKQEQESVATFEYPAFTAEMRELQVTEGGRETKHEWYVNDQSVTKAEFENLLQSGGPMLTQGMSPVPQNGGTASPASRNGSSGF